MIPRDLEQIKKVWQEKDMDAFFKKYATPDYVIMTLMWLFSMVMYFPMITGVFFGGMKDVGGLLLALPATLLLIILPFVLYAFCVYLIHIHRITASRILAITPAILSIIAIQSFAGLGIARDAKRHYADYKEDVAKYERKEEERKKETPKYESEYYKTEYYED